MNIHDLNNLNFLLMATPHELKDWYYAVDYLDHEYASGLLDAYSHELDLRSLALGPTQDLSLAREALAQFRL